MGGTMTGGQRTATSRRTPDSRTLSRLRRHYRGSTALSNRALFWGAPLVGAALLSAVPAAGNPTGGSVVGGNATISGEGTSNVTVNQTTDRAILHWDDFSIGTGEATQFVQPDSGSIAVNRVTGTAESLLLGTLTANGNVWIINPNGLTAGAGAIIDVNGFLASTADILDSDVLDGDNRFSFDIPSTNPDASIVNLGQISVGERGLAALVAPGVENDGLIVGRMAQVVLGGAETFALDFAGDGLLSFEIASPVTSAPDGMTDLVTNSGVIDASGGYVLLTADSIDGVVDNVINMSGVIRAETLTTANGQVILSGGDSGVVRVSGTIDATGTDAGETGGTVKLLGDTVALELDGLVDVSGDVGGGTVLVGGAFQGNGPEQNASMTFVGTDAVISADALTDGDGGTVVVWSDDYTQFYGTITARGGDHVGDGGLVEVSGKDVLSFTGMVDASAPFGRSGSLLLDPFNVEIVASSGAPTAAVGGTFTPTADDAEILNSAITAILNGGTDVTVNTNNAGPGTQDGNITVSAPVAVSFTGPDTDATFTLTAANDITVGDAITAAGGTLNVELIADDSAPVGGDVAVNATIDTNGGDFSSSGVAFDNTGGAIDAGGGTISLDHSGSVTVGDSLTATEVLVDAVGDITFREQINAGANGIVSLIATGNIVDAFGLAVGDVVARDLTIRAAGVGTGVDGTVDDALVLEVDNLAADVAGEFEIQTIAGTVGDGDLTIAALDELGPGGVIDGVTAGGPLEIRRTSGPSRSITIEAPVTASGTDDISLDTPLGITINDTIAAVDDLVELSTNSGITQNAVDGAITAAELLVVAADQVTLGADNQVGTLAANLTGTDADDGLTFNDLGGLEVGTVTPFGGGPAVSGVTTANGGISLTTDAGALTVAQAVTAGDTGDISLTTTTSGGVALNSTTGAAGDQVVISSAAGVTQDAAGGAITAAELLVVAADQATLGADNQVGTLAANLTGTDADDGLTFNDLGGLEVGTVTPVGGGAAVSGVTTANGGISLTTDAGALTVAQAVTAGDTGDISLTTTTSGGVALNSTTGAAGDQVVISSAAGVTQDAVGGAITAAELLVVAADQATLGADNQVGTLAANLTGTDADDGLTFNDLGGLEVGTVTPVGGGAAVSGVTTANGGISLTTDAGALTVAQAVTAGDTGDISLTTTTSGGVALNSTTGAAGDQVVISSAAGVTQDAAGGAITAAELLVVAADQATLGADNQVGTLAANLTGTDADDGLTFNDLGGLEVGTVTPVGGGAAVSGVTTANGGISLTTDSGALTVAQAVTAGDTGDISLTTTTSGGVALNSTTGAAGDQVVISSAAGVTQDAAGGAITAAELLVVAADQATLGADNQVGTLAANLTGTDADDGLTFNDLGGLEVGTVTPVGGGAAVSGVTTANGGISLTTDSGALTVAQAVTAGDTGDISLTTTTSGGVALNSTTGAAGDQVVISSAAGVTQDAAGGAITAAELLVVAADQATLGADNQVGTLAANLTGTDADDGLTFNDLGGLEVGTVTPVGGGAAVSGVTTANGGISLTTDAGALTVAQAVTAGDTGDISLTTTTSGGVALNSTTGAAGDQVVISSAAGVTQDAVGGAITAAELLVVAADQATLGADNQVGTLAANLTGTDADDGLTFNDLGGLEVGTVTPVGGGAAVSGVTTANGGISLTTDSGALTVAQAVTAGDTGDISLTTTTSGGVALNSTTGAAGDQVVISSAAGVTQDAAGGAITAAELLVVAADQATLGADNQVGTLAANLTGTDADDGLTFNDLGGLEVGTVTPVGGGAAVSGVTTANGGISLTTDAGALTVAQAVTAGDTGDISLTTTTSGGVALNSTTGAAGDQVVISSAAGVTQDAAGGAITAAELLVVAADQATLGADNQVGTLAANLTGTDADDGLTFNDLGGLEVGTVTPFDGGAAVSGVTTANGGISLTTDSGALTVAQAVTAGDTGDISLTTTTSGGVALNSTTGAAGDQVVISSAAGVTQDAVGGAITAAELLVVAADQATLGADNQVGTLAADVADSVAFNEGDGFVIGTVNGGGGIGAITGVSGTSVLLESGGAINGADFADTPEIVTDGDVTLIANGIGNSAPVDIDGTVPLVGDGNSTLTVAAGAGENVDIDILADLFGTFDLDLSDASSNVLILQEGGITLDGVQLSSTPGTTPSLVAVTDNTGIDLDFALNDDDAVLGIGIVIAGGNVAISSDNDIAVGTGGATAIDAGTFNVQLTADDDGINGGAIVDGGGTINMGGGELQLLAADGIGSSGGAIATDGLGIVEARTVSGDIFISNTGTGTVEVGTASSDFGLSAGGNISLTTDAGDLVIVDTLADNDVDGGGTVTLQATLANANLTVETGADVESTSGAHEYRADEIDIDGSVTAGSQTVTLRSATDTNFVDLGDFDGIDFAGTLDLNLSDLGNIAAGALVVGHDQAGAITVSQAITDPAGANSLTLESGSAIGQAGGAAITVGSLDVNGTVVTLTEDNDVGNLSGDVDSLEFTDDDGGINVTGLTSVGDVTITTDDIDVTGPLSAAGQTVTILSQEDGSIGIGSGGSGDMEIDGTDLANISAGTLRIGNVSDGTLGTAGAAITTGIDAGSITISPDNIGTLELRSEGNIAFGGTVNGTAAGGFDLTLIFGGTVTFDDSVGNSQPLGTVRFETPGTGTTAGNVAINNDAFTDAFSFDADRVEIDIAGSMTSNQILIGTSDVFDGFNVDTLSVERAASVTLFGSLGGNNTQGAASLPNAETPNGEDNSWLLNGCVIGSFQCFNVPIILPVAGLDLSLDDERLLREPLSDEEEEFEDLLSNTGNEELW